MLQGKKSAPHNDPGTEKLQRLVGKDTCSTDKPTESDGKRKETCKKKQHEKKTRSSSLRRWRRTLRERDIPGRNEQGKRGHTGKGDVGERVNKP